MLKILKLGDVITLQRGHDLPQTQFVKGKYLVGGSNGPIGYHNKFTTNGPGVTIGRSGSSIGVAHYYTNDYWAHNTTLYVKDFKGNYPKYIYYLLKFIDFNGLNSGSAIPSLNRNYLYHIEVNVPSFALQVRIADILSSLSDKIELNTQTNTTIEDIAQAIFKHYFVVGLASENLPEGWSIGKFEEYFDVIKGLSYKGSGLCGKGEGIPMYNLNSVYEGGGYKVEGIKYYKGEYKDRHLINPWDIIVTNTEQGHKLLLIGYPSVVPAYMSSPGIFTHHIYKVGIKNSIITPQYLYYLLLQPYVREQIISCTNGTTVNMLFADGLKIPEFIVPPRELVIKFSEFVADLWKMKEANHVESETLKNTFDTLLPKLMSGEVIPAELNQLENAL